MNRTAKPLVISSTDVETLTKGTAAKKLKTSIRAGVESGFGVD